MLRIEGRIANHDREFEGAVEIDTETGLIASIGPATGKSDLDLRGCVIFPGFGDIHIHAREDVSGTQMYKEDFSTASDAALAGGVVQAADMPNNPVAPVDDARYAAKDRLTAKSAVHARVSGVLRDGQTHVSHRSQDRVRHQVGKHRRADRRSEAWCYTAIAK